MASQYSDATSLPSTTYRDFVMSYVGAFDHYVLFQSEQYQYKAYVWNAWGKNIEITISRYDTSTGYNSRWRSDVNENATVNYTITEPMYAYSTEQGEGVFYKTATLDAAADVAALAIAVIIAVTLMWRRLFLWKR